VRQKRRKGYGLIGWGARLNHRISNLMQNFALTVNNCIYNSIGNLFRKIRYDSGKQCHGFQLDSINGAVRSFLEPSQDMQPVFFKPWNPASLTYRSHSLHK